MSKPLRLGMVGGGVGAFIGGVHRIAARLDGAFKLEAGAFSSDPERSRQSGKELGIDAERCYDSYQSMAEQESARPDGIDAVSIVTPNHLHVPVAEVFLSHGIHVICDKPLSTDLATAKSFAASQQNAQALFFLTHNYAGSPMVRQARDMVAAGKIGQLRLVQMEYVQDWLTEPTSSDNKQADWRIDPSRAGLGGAVGDIGTHAFQLAGFVTGQQPESLCADLTAFVPDRKVNDNAHILLRYASGAKGMIWVSQVAPGNENSLSLRVYGDKGGLEWRQEDPNYLWYTPFGQAKQLLSRGGAGSSDSASAIVRIPPGHPEGYLESFATIYKEAAEAIRTYKSGNQQKGDSSLCGVDEAVQGMAFVDACLRSSSAGTVMVPL